MKQSNEIRSLLDQLKIQVLLYSGTLIDYEKSVLALEELLTTAAALDHPRVNTLLESIDKQIFDAGGLSASNRALGAVHTRLRD